MAHSGKLGKYKTIEDRNNAILSCHGNFTYDTIAQIFDLQVSTVRLIMLTNGKKQARKSYSSVNAHLNDNVLKSLTGYSCPTCEHEACSEKTLISSSNPIFKTEPDPHYSWIEIHECSNCNTKYFYNNAT